MLGTWEAASKNFHGVRREQMQGHVPQEFDVQLGRRSRSACMYVMTHDNVSRQWSVILFTAWKSMEA